MENQEIQAKQEVNPAPARSPEMNEWELSSEPKSGKKYPPLLVENHAVIKARLEDGEYMIDIYKDLGIPRHLFELYVKDCPDLIQAKANGVEGRLDEHEKNIDRISLQLDEMEQGINPGVLMASLNASKFRLEKQGAARGYGIKIETKETGNGGMRPIFIMGDGSEEKIAEAEERVRKANEAAMEGLEIETDVYTSRKYDS